MYVFLQFVLYGVCISFVSYVFRYFFLSLCRCSLFISLFHDFVVLFVIYVFISDSLFR